ncbi:carboxypeptidase-like regulatory domain-containing protein [Flavobacterium sp. ANB]|uniref:carboxypeptidase-like regulatory domain-containing protein n=1 Tax=unclassified Flavobacterium TaxID=196869 RepID=UPI0012B9AF1F|nr:MULTISPECIES: carboxypeptidase-like regulatory domain-containing protein [unclassified Flavobacterium]MBF4519284.1 carboxypeptidase-like regulatory domain-containing protein [Flavobacterium sp. ANB]MTD72227.1 hypothetical protein [Flavobacterium sp. LC2016-13]
MTQNIKISIPKPCHENWLEMSPTEKGKFCSSCQKNVIDFTKASNREIILAYNENENLCDRFRISQLDRNIMIPKEKKSIWVIIAASVIAFLGLGNQTAKAQGNVRIEQTDKNRLNDSINIKSTAKNKYSGIVLDENNIPLPGAYLMIKGTKIGTQTDIDGSFSIEAVKGNILVVSYVSYKRLELTLNEKLNFSIKMKMDEIELQGFMIIKESEDD